MENSFDNIDNVLYKVCKDLKPKNIIDDSFFSDKHIIGDNTLMSGSIFANGRYEDTKEYKNVNLHAYDKLMEVLDKQYNS
jgi:hypothetical protein